MKIINALFWTIDEFDVQNGYYNLTYFNKFANYYFVRNFYKL